MARSAAAHTTANGAMTGSQTFEIGAFTFGELTANPVTGKPIDPAARLREFIDLAKLADHAGLDVFGVGEHHRPDFAIASPAVVLAAIAEATERIRLTSTVTGSTPGPAREGRCSPVARKRSSTRSSGSTSCSATTASSPRSASVGFPSPTPPARSSCSPPTSSPSSDGRPPQRRRSPDQERRRATVECEPLGHRRKHLASDGRSGHNRGDGHFVADLVTCHFGAFGARCGPRVGNGVLP